MTANGLAHSNRRLCFPFVMWMGAVFLTLLILMTEDANAAGQTGIFADTALNKKVIDYNIIGSLSSCACRVKCTVNASCTAVTIHVTDGAPSCFFSNTLFNQSHMMSNISSFSYVKQGIIIAQSAGNTETTTSQPTSDAGATTTLPPSANVITTQSTSANTITTQSSSAASGTTTQTSSPVSDTTTQSAMTQSSTVAGATTTQSSTESLTTTTQGACSAVVTTTQSVDTSKGTTTPLACVSPAVYVSGVGCILMTKPINDLTKAREECTKSKPNYVLYSPVTAEEFNTLAAYLVQKAFTGTFRIDVTYSNGRYIVANGSDVPPNIWGPGEPAASTVENCGIMDSNKCFKAATYLCSKPLKCICKLMN